MRLCQRPGCDAAADLYYKGPWCAMHAAQTYGAVIGTLSTVKTPGALGYAGSAAPSARPMGRVAAEALHPSSADAAPAPSITTAELLDTLAAHGLLDPVDLEWELVQRLEEDAP